MKTLIQDDARLEYSSKALGLMALLGLWHWASTLYPDFILPSPIETLNRMYQILALENGFSQIGITAIRALTGFALCLAVGLSLGVVAGAVPAIRYLLHPFERVMISVPPIALVVLTIIWFGATGPGSAVTTIVVASFPLVYIATVQGVRTLDKGLLDMGRSFGMSRTKAVCKIGSMHVLSLVFPAITTTFGQSWKVGVMAEVLGTTNGIGAQISTARAHLETADVFAWLGVAVVLFLITDKLLIAPINTYTMKWR